VADPVIGVDLLPTAYDHRLGIHYFDGHYLFMRSSMRLLVSATLLVVGVIHSLPLSGVLGGAFLIYAAVKPPLQGIALLAGLISVASFMILAWSVGGFSAQLATVFKADVVALGCLAIGVIAWWRATVSGQPV